MNINGQWQIKMAFKEVFFLLSSNVVLELVLSNILNCWKDFILDTWVNWGFIMIFSYIIFHKIIYITFIIFLHWVIFITEYVGA